jgi:hypothetical protein
MEIGLNLPAGKRWGNQRRTKWQYISYRDPSDSASEILM